MAQTPDYYLIGFNGIDTAADIKKTTIIEDHVAETRLAALLGSQGVEVPFLLSDKGVVIRAADVEHVAAISQTIANHPALALPEVEPVSNAPDMTSAFAKVAGAGYIQPVVALAALRPDPITTITGRIAPPRAANLPSTPMAMAA